jgi:hypothetical protein
MKATNFKPDVPDFLLGLDLGQAADFSALAVLERQVEQPADALQRPVSNYLLRHLKRWPLRTSYTQIVADMAELVQQPPLSRPVLAVDQTGAGKAVVDQLRHVNIKANLNPIQITGGHAITNEFGTWHVPKRELVSTVQVLLQAKRLKIAALPERELLVKELQAFRVKITINANETFESWRERDHDDLVLAVAMAAWLGEERGPACATGVVVIGGPRPSLTQRVFGSIRTWP